jgi:hypothetical protein
MLRHKAEADLALVARRVVVRGEDHVLTPDLVEECDGVERYGGVGEHHVNGGTLAPEHVQRITIGHVEKADAGRQAAVVIGVARRNVTASHRHGDGGGANIGANLEDRAAREGFDEKIDKTAIRVSGRATGESAPSPRRDVVIADGAQFLDQPMTVALVEAGDKFSGLHGRFSVADYAITGARHRFIMWSARFSTFNAASLTASLRVGCEWQVRPISSELPPNSITETASAISSDAA